MGLEHVDGQALLAQERGQGGDQFALLARNCLIRHRLWLNGWVGKRMVAPGLAHGCRTQRIGAFLG